VWTTVPTNSSKLGQNAIDDIAMDIGQTPPDTEVVERQLRVDDARLMQFQQLVIIFTSIS
jgi:hypothetical protein